MKKKNFYWLAVEKETLFKTPISKLFSGTYSTRFGSKEVLPPPPPPDQDNCTQKRRSQSIG